MRKLDVNMQSQEMREKTRYFNSFMTDRPLSSRSQYIDLQSKSMEWFVYERDLSHEGVKHLVLPTMTYN